LEKQKSHLLRTAVLIMALFTACLNSVSGQNPDSIKLRENAIKVFIDCDDCDINYIREEIPYINYVRDVKEALISMNCNSWSKWGKVNRKFYYFSLLL